LRAPQHSPEGWPSGLRRSLGKRVYGKPYRGFESHSLRHDPGGHYFSVRVTPLIWPVAALFRQSPPNLVKGQSRHRVLWSAVFLRTSVLLRRGTELRALIFSGTLSRPSSKYSRCTNRTQGTAGRRYHGTLGSLATRKVGKKWRKERSVDARGLLHQGADPIRISTCWRMHSPFSGGGYKPYSCT
jgi:hypothetical protein